MRAGFIEEPGKAYFKEVPEPQIEKSTDVKIKVVVTGICGSEVHAYHGKHAWRVPPLVSGHEFAGIVVEVGSDVTSVKVGDELPRAAVWLWRLSAVSYWEIQYL